MKKIILWLITKYQKSVKLRNILSFIFLIPQYNCKFKPTCSQYSFKAVEKYGIIKGVLLGLRRIFKCNPWNKGGFDPIP